LPQSIEVDWILRRSLYYRKTKNKTEKAKEIHNFINSCHVIINVLRKCGFVKTTLKTETILLRMYHTIHYAANPKFNLRKRNVINDATVNL